MDLVMVGSETGSSVTDPCVGLECMNSQELLWLSIREYEPYRIDYDLHLQAGYFYVGGQCGIGLFANHTFLWELREGFGAQNVVGRGFSDNSCHNGQFQVLITPNAGNILVDRRYQLSLELVGIGEGGVQYTNPMPSNKGSLDVLFVEEL